MTAEAKILPPSLDDFVVLAHEAMDLIPPALKDFAKDVVIHVTEFPDDEVCSEMGLESPFDIMGLYHGTAVGEKSIEASGTMPDQVFLYRRPILDYWAETGEDLRHVVRHVLIHEIGHHFGFSDDDMELLEQQAEAEDHARGGAAK
jgi:predicted Zn-dependent protease with MMP-like domain